MKRHHLAVLLQHSRWLNSDCCDMVDPVDYDAAIEFIVDYCKSHQLYESRQ